ncbi:hypothetical protein EIP91_012349 [Steccherinum ochraceum]|uniref:F-box domain-containing protein n=1 Tax=Steccherinum ochraceum TaxID=92696 RepID=A0A4R0RUP8_9APHY|nr:hypothetical protein EIP91_012349 [Steccherinum ochraceum]
MRNDPAIKKKSSLVCMKKIVRVCRHWRSVALNNPLLWCDIYVSLYSKKFIETSLSLARGMSLYFSVDYKHPNPDGLQLLATHANRIEGLRMDVASEALSHRQLDLPSALPLLQLLDITFDSSSAEMARLPSLLTRQSPPSLRSLSVLCFQIAWKPGPGHVLPISLTRLSVEYKKSCHTKAKIIDVVEAIGALPNLMHLELVNVLADCQSDDGDPPLAATKMDLRRMRSLTLQEGYKECSYLLSHFILSPVADIDLLLTGTPEHPEKYGLPILIPIIRNFLREEHGWRIRELVVNFISLEFRKGRIEAEPTEPSASYADGPRLSIHLVAMRSYYLHSLPVIALLAGLAPSLPELRDVLVLTVRQQRDSLHVLRDRWFRVLPALTGVKTVQAIQCDLYTVRRFIDRWTERGGDGIEAITEPSTAFLPHVSQMCLQDTVLTTATWSGEPHRWPEEFCAALLWRAWAGCGLETITMDRSIAEVPLEKRWYDLIKSMQQAVTVVRDGIVYPKESNKDVCMDTA